MKTVLYAAVGPLGGPYLFQFPCALTGDEVITLKGRATHDGKPRINVNILENAACEDNILLHLNPRLDEHILVRNVRINGEYGKRDEHGEMPLVRGEEFDMKIVVHATHYEIWVNGKKHSDFDHRMPISRAKYIYFHGCIEVNNLTFSNGSDKFASEPITDLKVPFATPVSVHPGRKIYISGIAPEHADRYTVNLCANAERLSGDIMFHASMRFQFSPKVTSFNALVGGSWLIEDIPTAFPFEAGKFHNITIEVTEEGYKVDVNDQEYYLYKHRAPIEDVKHLVIDGDFELRRVIIV